MTTKEPGRDEVKTKGLNFRSFTESLRRLRGDAALQATLDEVAPEVREAIRSGHVIATGWYPISWYRELHRAARKALDAGVELPRAIGRDSTSHDFNTLFRLVLKMLSVETVAGQTSRLLTLYFQGGTAESVMKRPGVVRVRLTGWNGFDRNVWEDLSSGAEVILELCGAKNVRRYWISGGHDGSDGLELELRWD